MPRKSRKEEAGAFHHVWARGNNREDIFRDDGDRQVFLVILTGVVRTYGWRLSAYCLMRNHIHLAVMTPLPNLGDGMRRLNGAYGAYFNRRHDRSGHVFKRPFGSERAKDDAQVAVVIAYVARNPVTGGLCATPDEWRWSSHGRGVDVHRRVLMGARDIVLMGARDIACEHPVS
jgi:REP element-mobilizing transposase RayT